MYSYCKKHMASKKEIIEKVYYETFGSIKDVLKDAKALAPKLEIKEKDVKEWKDRAVHRKINLAGANSFVASKPKEEYQMDLFEMPISRKQHMGHWKPKAKARAKRMAELRGLGEEYATGSANNKNRMMKGVAIVPQTTKDLYKFGLLLVDIFTKFVAIIPIEDNTTANVLEGLKEAIVEMGGEPETIYSDAEGALLSTEGTAYFKATGIRLITTRTHAWVAERHIRTVKDMMFKRMTNREMKVDIWHTLLDEILTRFNTKMIHSATGMTPVEAKRSYNEAVVKGRLQVKQLKTRKYPEVDKGDTVRIYQKKDKMDKEDVSTWSNDKYKVTEIETSHGQTYYTVDPQPRGWKGNIQRSEILKVA